MEDKESGSLSEKSVLDLLMELHRGTVTGSLKLERAPLQKAVYFREGQILFAASNDPKDQLASILVEEGKLGPDQMQVAQARVSPGNPLAKVLTELGYISQRELADAARLKVEKILTDLYAWKEGTYQFATKSLPKGAIDLDLSTARLLFNSIRRIQDREWVLRQLGSLEAVLGPGTSLSDFIQQAQADDASKDVLELADGVKTVKQIASVSSLGEFDVSKILAAATILGVLDKGHGQPAAPPDAFSMPPAVPPAGSTIFDASVAAPSPGGVATVGLEQPAAPPPFEAPPSAKDMPGADKTVFDPAPSPPPAFEPPPPSDFGTSEPTPGSSQLLIDEPEPDIPDGGARRPPRPRRKGGSSSSSGIIAMVVKLAAVLVLVAAAAGSVYYFVWPMVRPEDAGSSAGTTTTPPGGAPVAKGGSPSPPASVGSAGGTPGTNPQSAGTTTPPSGSATTTSTAPPPKAGTSPGTRPPTPKGTAPTGTGGTSPRPPPPKRPTTTTARPTPPPPPPGGGSGRDLLRTGQYSRAASAFMSELRTTGSGKVTIALGLYCDEGNVGRVVDAASSASQLYLLPTEVQGRSCYRVVWGLFDSRESARSAIGSVPATVRTGDAAPIALSRLMR